MRDKSDNQVDKYTDVQPKHQVRVRELSWEKGNCVGQDVNKFISEEKGQRKRLIEFAAKQICKGCPLLEQCRDWAIDHNEKGIWGGMDEPQRKNYSDLRQMLTG